MTRTAEQIAAELDLAPSGSQEADDLANELLWVAGGIDAARRAMQRARQGQVAA